MTITTTTSTRSLRPSTYRSGPSSRPSGMDAALEPFNGPWPRSVLDYLSRKLDRAA